MYIIKKHMYMCMWDYLDKYIRVTIWPPQTKILGSAPGLGGLFGWQ